MELIRFAVAYHGVSGVAAARRANYVVRRFGKNVDDFALALVAPLSAYQCDCIHVTSDNGCRGSAENGLSLD